jgi:hypothetical protein
VADQVPQLHGHLGNVTVLMLQQSYAFGGLRGQHTGRLVGTVVVVVVMMSVMVMESLLQYEVMMMVII